MKKLEGKVAVMYSRSVVWRSLVQLPVLLLWAKKKSMHSS